MKTNTIITALKAVAVLAVLFTALFLIFCTPDESMSAGHVLWTLLWTKALGVVLFGAVIIFCNAKSHVCA